MTNTERIAELEQLVAEVVRHVDTLRDNQQQLTDVLQKLLDVLAPQPSMEIHIDLNPEKSQG